MDVTSELGVGSIFRLKLPYRPVGRTPLKSSVNEPQERSAQHQRVSGKVLVVDDVPIMQALEKRMLEQVGASVVVASNGKEAVERALQEHFDLILMDMEMPVMGGVEATSILREQSCEAPIIALTAYTEQRYQDEFFEAGCDGFMSKPLDHNELRYVVNQYLLKQMSAQSDEELITSFVQRTSRSKEALIESLQQLDWEQTREHFNHLRRVPTASRYVEELVERLEKLYSSYAQDGYNLSEDIVELADEVVTKLTEDADLFIGVIHLYTHFPHTIMRTIQNTMVAVLTAQRLGWSEHTIRALSCASLTQNLGLYPMQNDLHEMEGTLSTFHQMHIRLHPKNSVKALIKMGVTDRTWLNAVAYHHEMMDGSGYPNGYHARDIPLEARLIALSDRYGAMISPRRYRSPGTPRQIMQQFVSSKKGHYDVQLSKVLIAELGIYPPGTTVKLASGEIALVVKRGESALHPMVMAVWDKNGECYQRPLKRDVQQQEYSILSVSKHPDATKLNADRFWGGSAHDQRQPLFR